MLQANDLIGLTVLNQSLLNSIPDGFPADLTGGNLSYLKNVLESPSYGFERNGKFYKPTQREILTEFLNRLNLFNSRKNWLSAFFWITNLALALPLTLFLTHYFSLSLLLIGMVYSMVILGTYGTFYLHRYSTHHAFTFTNSVWRLIGRNLVIKVIPEEVYVISHHVHHQYSEQAGDPYNVHGGWLYCFLADVNHQGIRRDLSEAEYKRLVRMIEKSGVQANRYDQYLKWGSLCHPVNTILHYTLNWAFWYGTFYLLGGHALATAIFGCTVIWAFGVRTYNFDGHGGGKDRRQEGIDFNRADLSVNQIWPGFVAGEWHNNHHLFPNGARSGFLSYQMDSAWILIRFFHWIGGISSYRDYKAEFIRDYWTPYQNSRQEGPSEDPSLKGLVEHS